MYAYIIKSASSGDFYVGETEDPHTRLAQNNQAVYKGAFTSRHTDWQLVAVFACRDRAHARKVEAHIKKMRSRTYIENLIKFSEMREKMIAKY